MLFAQVAEAGNAILFVSSLLLWVIVFAYTLAYALRCYLIVVQGTTAGIDRVDAPDEPLLDWLLSSVPTLFMMAMWLIPPALLSRALARDLPAMSTVERFFLLAAPFLWAFWPLGLLSSMAAASPWVPLTPKVVFGLIRLFPYTVLFYLMTAAILAVSVALGYLGLFSPAWYALPVAAVLGSAGWLIHARLVGRMGWLLQRLYEQAGQRPAKAGKRKKAARRARAEEEAEEKEAEEEEPLPRKPRARKKVREGKREQEEERPAAPGYRAVEQPAEKKAPRPASLDPEPEPYTLAGGVDEPAPEPVRDKLELEEHQVQREIELRERKPPNPPPEWPLFSGVYNFPAYPTTQKAWLWLSLWGLASGYVFRMVLQFHPFR